MSQENVELVRRSYDAFNRDGLEGMLRYFDRKIEWTTTGTFIEPATSRGHEGVRQYLGTPLNEFEDVHAEPEEIIEAGPGRLFISARFSGRGRLSGARVEAPAPERDGMACAQGGENSYAEVTDSDAELKVEYKDEDGGQLLDSDGVTPCGPYVLTD